MPSTRHVNLLVDGARVAPLHWLVLGCATLVIAVDGFDTFMVGRIAPAIAAGFDAAPRAMTGVFVWQQVGLGLGAFLLSPAADRVGRRTVLAGASLLYGLLTLAALSAQDLGQFIAIRAVAGLFLGGIVPNASALVAEYAPRARRATFLSLLYAGYSLGSASGAFVAILVARHGWQLAFWLGGLLPLGAAALFLLLVPESPRFLAARDPADPRLVRTLRRLDPALDLSGPAVLAGAVEDTPPRARPALLFTRERYRLTLLIWCATFLNMGSIALLSSWLVLFFQELGGIGMARFALVSTLGVAGAFAGTLAMGPLTDRFRPTRVIAAMLLLSAAALAAMGILPFGTAGFALALLAQGFAQSAGQAGINAFIGQSYPTEVRATGFGWAGTVGRIAGVASPVAGGLILANHLGLAPALALCALPGLAVAGVMLAIERVRPPAEGRLARA